MNNAVIKNIILREGILSDPTHIEGCKFLIDAGNAGSVKSGNAAQFTRANSEYLSLADNAAMSTGDINFTVAGWFYNDSEPAGSQLGFIGKGNSATVREYDLLYQTSDDKVYFTIFNSSGTNVGQAGSAAGFSTATWYYYVAWHDSVANTVNLQINNGTVVSVATSGVPSDTAGNFVIGRASTGLLYHDGRGHDVIFAKQIYTAAERTYLYNSGNGRRFEDLGIAGTDGANINVASGGVAYYKLGEQSGQRNDSWGTNHLTDNATVTQNDGVALKDIVDAEYVRQASDLSGSNNAVGTGNVTTKPIWDADGANGHGALVFDVVDDVLNAGSDASLDDLSAMTIFVVINPTSFGENGFGRVLDKSAGVGPTSGWHVAMDNTNVTNGLALAVDYNTTDLLVRAQNIIVTGSWQIFAITWDGSVTATNVHIYKNGIEASYGTQQNAEGTRQTDAGQNLLVGNEPSGTRTFDGQKTFIDIHNRVMNAGELKRMFRYLGRKYGIAVV